MRPNAEPSAQFQILPLGSELDIVCNMGEYVLLQSIWSLVLPYQQASVADLISSSVAWRGYRVSAMVVLSSDVRVKFRSASNTEQSYGPAVGRHHERLLAWL